ncbi:histidine-type phosphatase [Aeromicrobium sp. Root472D3]|uniref:histidine-type phosphatase n=1 Tax=Aeromicrobium sp. Root472D3 TaxID=1736540 RepID=UPI0006F3E1A8|nr:histidine-type phosphatase [Aeromicrobium sp. Root472D3]KQX75551.1 hypothetical protein ASD10_10405 [Aeromicrobium sp. Root472D3]
MRSRLTASASVLVTATALVAVTLPLSSAHAADGPTGAYANQQPYGDPASTQVVAPPTGYDLFFVENVGRHGARSLTSSGAEKRALAVWRGAARRGDLTTRGRTLDDRIRTFQRAEKKLGYGNLSSVGKQEWRGIGRRTATSYAGFLSASAARGEKVAMQTSPVYRTKQSAVSLRQGLESVVPGLRTSARTVNRDLLIEEGSTSKGRAAIAKAQRRSSVKAAARQVLLRAYRPSYVKRLADPVGAALDLHLLYSTAAGMAGDTRVTFAEFVPLQAARRLAEATDARTFYRFGPGVSGQSTTYRQARPVLDDFFAALDRRVAGGDTAAVFRLAHGEVTMPFAALIKAPGSQKQASRTFSYGSNPWRGSVAGRLASNIEWAAYRNAGGEVLVTMRVNEQPVQFNASCTPSASNPYFYRLDQLRTCLT